jgi:hypothetical protein
MNNIILSKGITASCLNRPLKSLGDIISIILDYAADVPDDDTKEEETIDEYIMLNVERMAFLEETRLSNVWQIQIKQNFSNLITRIDLEDENTEIDGEIYNDIDADWGIEIDEEIWKEDKDTIVDWDTDYSN